MGNRIIQLHGGPMHGKKIDLPDDQDHFHVAGPAGVPDDYALTEEDMIKQVPYKEGMYSKVRGHADDFEWDGWRTHD